MSVFWLVSRIRWPYAALPWGARLLCPLGRWSDQFSLSSCLIFAGFFAVCLGLLFCLLSNSGNAQDQLGGTHCLPNVNGVRQMFFAGPLGVPRDGRACLTPWGKASVSVG